MIVDVNILEAVKKEHPNGYTCSEIAEIYTSLVDAANEAYKKMMGVDIAPIECGRAKWYREGILFALKTMLKGELI